MTILVFSNGFLKGVYRISRGSRVLTESAPAPGSRSPSYIDMYLGEIEQAEGDEKEHLQGALTWSLDNFLMSTSDLVMAFHTLLYCLAKHPGMKLC